MSTICFEATPLQIGDWTILRLPESASARLPSRGMALVEGTINGFRSKIVLEPDGRYEISGLPAGPLLVCLVTPFNEPRPGEGEGEEPVPDPDGVDPSFNPAELRELRESVPEELVAAYRYIQARYGTRADSNLVIEVSQGGGTVDIDVP